MRNLPFWLQSTLKNARALAPCPTPLYGVTALREENHADQT